MFDRIKLGALLLIGIALPIMGCGTSEVDSLQVTPTLVTMVPGATIQLTATGIYSHGTGPSTTQDLTSQVTWKTASADVATVSSTGVVTGVGPGTISITASIKGFTGLLSATSAVTVIGSTTPPVNNDITTLTITPSSQTLASPGATATYTAVGTTAGGASVNVNGLVVWSSSSSEIATVNASTGVVTATGPGTATIQAQFTNADSTVATGTASITVTGTGSTDNDITSITVIPGGQSVPSPGDTATFVAVGTTGSGSTVSMSGLATWSASAPQIGTINATTGVATAVGQGTTTITAQYVNSDKTIASGTATFTVSGSGTTNSDIAQVSIIPSGQTVASAGDTATYTAVGTTASGLTQNLNGQVVWSASSPQIATIDATSGVATGVGQGTTTISAVYTNADKTIATGTATFTVTGSGAANNDITTLTIIPGSQSVPAPGDQATFLVIGNTATGETVSLGGQVTWSSSSTTIAQVDPQTGVATGESAGAATITASYTNPDKSKTVATGTASFTVLGGTTEQWTAVSILPSSQSISAEGQAANLIALGTAGSSGLVENVTSSSKISWSSSNQAVAIVSPTGVVTGKGVGSTTITALLANNDGSVVTGNAAITTTLTTPAEPILSLSVIPSAITFGDASQETGQFLAIATYSSAPYIRDVTNDPSTTWLSSEPEIFTVGTNSGGNPGASAGLVTDYDAFGASAVIIAETLSPGSTTSNCLGSTSGSCSIQSATATVTCPELLPPPPGSLSQAPGTCYPTQPVYVGLLQTLTVYNEGLNTTNWEITASSATGTADVLHCGPGWTLGGGAGGSVCTATYPLGTTVTLTATQPGTDTTTATFGGWSYNCAPVGTVTNGPTNSCKVTLTSDDTVGAIFN